MPQIHSSGRRRRRERGAVLLMLAACASVMAGCDGNSKEQGVGKDVGPAASAGNVRMPPIPTFPHESMEPAVRAQFEEARAALEPDPANAQANGRYGMLFHAYELPGLAEACYRRALARLAPASSDRTDWAYLLGVVLAEQGESDEARTMFQSVLDTQPNDAAAMYRLAELDRAGGADEQALDEYMRTIELSADHAQAHCGAAHVQLQLRQLGEAESHARKAIELCSVEGADFGRAHYVLGQILREQGRMDEAKAEFALAEQQTGREPALPDLLMMRVQGQATGTIDALRRGVELMLQGRVTDAIPLLENAVEMHPGLAEAHGQLGSALLVIGELDRAELELRRAIELNSTYTDALYNLGQLEYQRGRPAEAAVNFEHAVALQPEYVEAQRGLGTVLPLLGRDDDAMDHLRKAIALRADDDRPYKQLAALLDKHDRDAEAVELLRDAAARLPDDLSIRDRLAWVLATSNDNAVRDASEALRLATEVESRTNHPRPLATLAAAQSATGDQAAALQSARTALSAAKRREDHELIDLIEWMIKGLETGKSVFELSEMPQSAAGKP